MNERRVSPSSGDVLEKRRFTKCFFPLGANKMKMDSCAPRGRKMNGFHNLRLGNSLYLKGKAFFIF